MTEARRDSLTASTIGIASTLIAAAYSLVVLSFLIATLAPSGGGPGPGFRTLDVTVAVSLVVAGGITLSGGGRRRVAVLAAACALAWTGPIVLSEPAASGAVRAVAHARTPLGPVLVLHLVVLSTANGRLDPRPRVLLVALSASAGAVALLTLATYDPFYDLGCRGCGSVPALLDVSASVRSVVRLSASVVGIASGLALSWWSFRDLSARRRSSDRLILAGGMLGGIAIVGEVTSAALTGSARLASVGAPADDAEAWLFGLLAVAMLTVVAGLVMATIALLQVRVRLWRIADEIEAAPPPGTLETAVGFALGDPTLRVGYRRSDVGGYVAPDGKTFDGTSLDAARHGTPILRAGTPIAIITHRADLDVSPLRELRASLLIALDNERLRATSLAHLRDLRASRARIVSVGDVERRRIERDLHDGAQQGLLAVSFDLRLAKHQAERNGDVDRARRLGAAEAVCLAAVDELRRVAKGVHPAVLTQAGLVAALHSLRDEALIPMDVSADLSIHPPTATEAAAYQVVVDALADAALRGAHGLTVRIHGDADQLILDVADDGTTAAEPPTNISDRVGASGGSVVARRGPDGRGNILSAVIPCA
ncbi:MAG: sensor histidine kinase [Candidatus Limnocylindrales bacterium]